MMVDFYMYLRDMRPAAEQMMDGLSEAQLRAVRKSRQTAGPMAVQVFEAEVMWEQVWSGQDWLNWRKRN